MSSSPNECEDEASISESDSEDKRYRSEDPKEGGPSCGSETLSRGQRESFPGEEMDEQSEE